MARLRWGILGTGNIARQFAAGIGESDRGVMTAVGSRSRASAQAFCRGLGLSAEIGSYDDLIRSPTVDAVYVSLPNTMHHEWTIAALRAGKHVLCEKPIAVSACQAEEMFDIARQAGRVLIEAFMYRAHPQTHKIIELVRGGVCGPIRLVRTSFCFRVRKVQDNIRFDPSLAGGVLMDVGCYCISFARLIAGAEPIATHVISRRHAGGVDEQMSGLLEFPDGLQATFSIGMTVQADNAALVCGEEGYLRIPVPWKPPPGEGQVVLARAAPPRQDGGPTIAPPPVVHAITDRRPLYGIEADAFAAAVAGEVEPFVTPADTLGNMRVLDTLRRQTGMLSS